MAEETPTHRIGIAEKVARTVFVLSVLVTLLDIFEVVQVRWDELELAVVFLSGVVAFSLWVLRPEGEAPQADDIPSRFQGHEFDARGVCTRCRRSYGAVRRFQWSCEAAPSPSDPDLTATPMPGADVPTRGPAADGFSPAAEDDDALEERPGLLYSVARAGDAELLQAVLDQGVPVNARTGGGATSLMAAAEKGHDEVVDLLLAHGADVDAQAESGHSALYLAAQNGHTRLVEALIASGATLDLQTGWGATALQVAAQQGHTEVAKVLLAHGADVDLESQFVPCAAVIAVHEGHSELTELLREATGGLVRMDGLSYLGTLGEHQLPIGFAWLSDEGRVEITSQRGSVPVEAESRRQTAYGGGTRSGASKAEGRAAIFVFDYDQMSDTYGMEAFRAIAEGLAGSRGACAFLDGDLEIAAGGVSGVPALLMEIRDNGWMIQTSRADSPLIFLAALDHLHGYAAAMWTNAPENVDVLDRHLSARLPASYLGCLQHPRNMAIEKFHEIFRPLHLPVRATFVDGEERGRGS